MVASSGVGKGVFADKKFIISGAIACIVIGGGAYYFYRCKDSKTDSANESDPPTATLEATVSDETEPLVDAQGMKERGNKYFKGGKFAKAIECYTKAIELCSEDSNNDLSTFYQNRAAANEQLKDWKSVVADCTIAIENNPRYAKALHRRAKAYEALDQKRNCLEDVTAVCLLDGFSDQKCMELADRILKGIGKDLAAENYPKRPSVLPSSLSIRAYLDSFSKNVFDVSSREMELPGDATYFEILDLLKNNEFENILDMCEKVIESGSKFRHHALLLQGTLKTLMNSNPSALDDFDKVIDAEDSDVPDMNDLKVDGLIKRASLKMQLDDDVGCYADLAKAIEIDETNVNIYHSRGQLFSHKDRDEEATKEFRKAISLDSSYIPPRIQLGYCLCKIAMQKMSTSVMKLANEVLEETIRLFPNSSEAFSMYGQLLQDQQRCEEAMTMLDKAISLSPLTATTYVYKALLFLQWKKDTDEATRLIRKAIELDEKCDFAYETLATLEVQAGNEVEALRLFECSLKLVRTEAEMANTYSLLEAAKAQGKITKQLGVQLTPNASFM